MSTREAAKAIGAGERTLARYAAQGAPHDATGSGRRWNAEELLAWRRSRGLTGRPGAPSEWDVAVAAAPPSKRSGALEAPSLLTVRERARKALADASDAFTKLSEAQEVAQPDAVARSIDDALDDLAEALLQVEQAVGLKVGLHPVTFEVAPWIA